MKLEYLVDEVLKLDGYESSYKNYLRGAKMDANKTLSSEIWVYSRWGANMEANNILILK